MGMILVRKDGFGTLFGCAYRRMKASYSFAPKARRSLLSLTVATGSSLWPGKPCLQSSLSPVGWLFQEVAYTALCVETPSETSPLYAFASDVVYGRLDIAYILTEGKILPCSAIVPNDLPTDELLGE